MNYLYNTRPPKGLSGTIVVSISVMTSGPVIFNYMTESFNTCPGPATARPFFIANRFDWAGEFSRWWANPVAHVLAAGSATLTIPVTPEHWSSVYGKFGNADAAARDGFNRAADNPSGLGLTFGGGCFFGHGVFVQNGTARVTITRYQMQ